MIGFEIESAHWNLGMNASIELRTMPVCKFLRITFHMDDGLELSESQDGGRTWPAPHRVKKEELIDLLNSCYESQRRGVWTWESFQIAWRAFAEGYEKALLWARATVTS